MTDIQLSLPERTALLALATLIGEVSNKDLRERYGFALDGKDRIHLTECGYVSSRRGDEFPGRPFVHELTELGWRRARQELAAAAPPRATKPYRLLYGWANAIDRFMTRSGFTLADVLPADEGEQSEVAETPVDAGTRICAAYADLAEKPGAPVRLLPLRERLIDLPPTEFDAALLQLAREPGVLLEPEPKLRSLTEADRNASVRVGGEVKHLLSIEPS